LTDGVTVQRATLGDQLTIEVRPKARATGAEIRLDGTALVAHTVEPGVLTVAVPELTEGRHELTVRVKRWGYGDVVRRWSFVLDNSAPALDMPAEVAPVAIDQPYTLTGTAEAGSAVAVAGAEVQRDGDKV